MNDDTAGALLQAFDQLLERERTALMSGNLEDLNEILTEKAALIDRLGSDPLDADRERLGELRGKAQRNQELMDNAMRGIRSVATRLGTMRRLRRALETYDQSGRRTTIVTGGAQVEKRA